MSSWTPGHASCPPAPGLLAIPHRAGGHGGDLVQGPADLLRQGLLGFNGRGGVGEAPMTVL